MDKDRKTVHVKLIEGSTYTCPDGTKLDKKKPLGPISADHKLIPYFRSLPRVFQIVESVSRGPAPRRRARGGRGGLAPEPVREEPKGVPFGAKLDAIAGLTRAELIERIAKYNLEVPIRKSTSKPDIAKAVFAAEQELLSGDSDDEGDDEDDDNSGDE